MSSSRKEQYDVAAQQRIFGSSVRLSAISIDTNCNLSSKDTSYWELAKRTCPAIFAGAVALMMKSYWPVLITSQALPPLGAAALIAAGVLLICYGVYQGAKYLVDLKNKPDYEEDVTPVEQPIDGCWDRVRRWGH